MRPPDVQMMGTPARKPPARTGASPTSEEGPAAAKTFPDGATRVRSRANGSPAAASAAPLDARVAALLQSLQRRATKATRAGMARYAIPADHAYGVAVRDIKAIGQAIGRDHELALALWATGVYEARMLVSFVGDPDALTPAQMDRWCRDFDNWAYCDTLCFNLFDRSPHAWDMVPKWAGRQREFEKRTAFALLWSLSVHDPHAGDAPFLAGLALVEREAADERNFVHKAVSMALRAIGKRNPALHAAALASARRLAAATDATARRVGQDALRELAKAKVRTRAGP